jgi:hypothetical protein
MLERKIAQTREFGRCRTCGGRIIYRVGAKFFYADETPHLHEPDFFIDSSITEESIKAPHSRISRLGERCSDCVYLRTPRCTFAPVHGVIEPSDHCCVDFYPLAKRLAWSNSPVETQRKRRVQRLLEKIP